MLMKYWLIKTEPEEWSWQQQVKSGNKGAEWNGVRNFQAAKNLKNMKKVSHVQIVTIVLQTHKKKDLE